MSRIIGLPLKIFDTNLIYIPKTYWQHYRIDSEHDEVVRAEFETSIVFRRYEDLPLQHNESIRRVYMCSVHIHPDWLARNDVSVGGKVWLIGVEDGILIKAQKIDVEF